MSAGCVAPVSISSQNTSLKNAENTLSAEASKIARFVNAHKEYVFFAASLVFALTSAPEVVAFEAMKTAFLWGVLGMASMESVLTLTKFHNATDKSIPAKQAALLGVVNFAVSFLRPYWQVETAVYNAGMAAMNLAFRTIYQVQPSS